MESQPVCILFIVQEKDQENIYFDSWSFISMQFLLLQLFVMHIPDILASSTFDPYLLNFLWS